MRHEVVVKCAIEAGMTVLRSFACSDRYRATHCRSITEILCRWSLEAENLGKEQHIIHISELAGYLPEAGAI